MVTLLWQEDHSTLLISFQYLTPIFASPLSSPFPSPSDPNHRLHRDQLSTTSPPLYPQCNIAATTTTTTTMVIINQNSLGFFLCFPPFVIGINLSPWLSELTGGLRSTTSTVKFNHRAQIRWFQFGAKCLDFQSESRETRIAPLVHNQCISPISKLISFFFMILLANKVGSCCRKYEKKLHINLLDCWHCAICVSDYVNMCVFCMHSLLE